MDIRALRYFAEVVNCGGFSRASEVLHVTQPAISRAVRLLEEECGIRLLTREPKTVKLTREGEVVYRHATQMLRQARQLTSELTDMKSELKGVFRVGLPPLVGSTFFSGVIARFRSEYPGIELQIAEFFSSRLEQALDDGEIDIAAAMLPIDTERFVAQLFAADQLMFVVNPGHEISTHSAMRILALKSHPLVTFTQDFKLCRLIEDACRAQGFVPSIVGRSSHLDFVLAMVASGMGVTVLPRSVIEKANVGHFVSVPIVKPAIHFELALVRPRESYVSHECRAWLELAASALGFQISDSFVCEVDRKPQTRDHP
ncbi:LysR family transcriptional regulator [Paraburkholderia sp. 2C]